MITKKTPWYIAGLHFECHKCGRCCAGPGEGYIWMTRPEIKIIAEFLKLTPAELRRKFLKRLGLRTTIIEQPVTKDCIFLREVDSHKGTPGAGRKTCLIYSVRPNQCRTWPFWPENLESPDAWNIAAQKCPGINHGKLYSCDEIEKIGRSRKWWLNSK